MAFANDDLVSGGDEPEAVHEFLLPPGNKHTLGDDHTLFDAFGQPVAAMDAIQIAEA